MRFLIAMLCLCLCAAAGHAAAAGFDSTAHFSRWLSRYYTSPEPERIADAIGYMSASGILDDENARAPMFGFLSGVFRDNPQRIAGWAKDAAVTDEAHLAIVVLGAWYAGLEDSPAIAQALVDAHPRLATGLALLNDGGPMTVEQIPLEQGAWVLDALWGKFMASGGSEPVERIISALPWADLTGDTDRALIGGAARWSLTSNAVQHERVLAICIRMAHTLEGVPAAKLREVIDEARKQLRALEHRGVAQAPAGDALRPVAGLARAGSY